MKRVWKKVALIALLLTVSAMAGKAEAIPLLQLDMAGGVYDPVTETIVAPGGAFTVYALLTPQNNATPTQITALLNTTYFLSAALVPKTAPPGGNYGSFTMGLPGTVSTCRETTGSTPGPCPQTVLATHDMAYGVPPLELMSSTQGWDAQDLSQHGIYETYFSEFSFKFSPLQTTAAYNTQDNPGGPSAGAGAYYAAFVGNSSLLSPNMQLHFDLYSEVLKDCSTKKTHCTDVDRDKFAPFSHDAQTITRVPEPGAALLMLAGLAVGGRRLRRPALRA